MLRVTAADFTKRFGQYRDLALRAPVLVTHHGRDTLVLIAADEYHRLKSFDGPRDPRPEPSQEAREQGSTGAASLSSPASRG